MLKIKTAGSPGTLKANDVYCGIHFHGLEQCQQTNTAISIYKCDLLFLSYNLFGPNYL